MKFVWSITLYETAKGFRVTIMGDGQTVHGEGSTPQAAHRAAEAPLVVKPWVAAEPAQRHCGWFGEDRGQCVLRDGHRGEHTCEEDGRQLKVAMTGLAAVRERERITADGEGSTDKPMFGGVRSVSIEPRGTQYAVLACFSTLEAAKAAREAVSKAIQSSGSGG